MGRSPKESAFFLGVATEIGVRKTQSLSCRLTPDERAAFERKALQAGTTAAALLRDLVRRHLTGRS